MADLLRRILWQFPVFVAGALLLFFCLGSTQSIQSHLSRPLFYNPEPESAQVSTRRVLERLKANDPEAVRQLRVLGGAALPVLLEELPSLSVQQQRVVSAALSEVAARMRISGKKGWGWEVADSGSKSTEKADQALLFWERYREEHALDLRPLATSRLVKRAAQRDARLKNADLLAVDTYALPALVASLGRITTPDDTKRVRRLVAVIAHVTERDWNIPTNAQPEDARRVASEIREFWDEHGGQWTQLGRFELLVAQFSQTEFASWVFRTTRQSTGLDHPKLAERLSRLGQISIPLGLFCLLGLLVAGPAVAATIQVLQLRQTRWRLERWGLRGALAGGLMVLLPLLVTPGISHWWRLSLLSMLMGTVVSAFILSRELGDRLDWRTHHVLRKRPGLGKVAAVTRWLAPSIPTLTPIAVAEAALWVTCLEFSSRTDGLGSASLRAMRSGDIDFLMALCLGLGVVTGFAQIFADLLLGTGRTRQGES